MSTDAARLPAGWTLREPDERDVVACTRLRLAVADRAVPGSTADVRSVLEEITGLGSWTRRQVVAVDPQGRVRAWAAAHDRAAGRVLAQVTVEPDDAVLPREAQDAVAAALLAWLEDAARAIGVLRRLTTNQIDTGSYDGDERQAAWLTAAGFRKTRTWLQMKRPVDPVADHPTQLPRPRTGTRVHRIRLRANGVPMAADVRAIHEMLEASFADHFNSYRESFPEFITRLQEDPGHRWEDWWLAEYEHGGEWVAGGALVSTILEPDESGAPGAYVDYIGVHRDARGKGLAKSLLYRVVEEAALRGRNRVGLEVDADSPTHADGLYRSLGWETAYRTCSWHKDIDVPATHHHH